MRQMAMRWILALGALAVAFAPTQTRANRLDLSLGRFVECDAFGRCSPRIAEYEKFLAEYAFGLSPKILAPAETLGYSGFYLGLEGTLTTIPVSETYRWKAGTAPADSYPGVMFVPTIHMRKGLPWSFEIGGTINYLAQSEVVALGMDVKWSLFEGYRKGLRGGLPDVAARGSVVRVLGQSDVDMTIVGVDGSISYPFGIGGLVTLTPYGGAQYLWTIVRVEPLVYREEGNPPTFEPPVGDRYNMTGLSGPNLERLKLFLGLRFGYEVLSITAELGWGVAKEWETSVVDQTYPLPTGASFDETQTQTDVGDQLNISLGVGLDF